MLTCRMNKLVVTVSLLSMAGTALAASSTAHVDKTVQYSYRSKDAAVPAMTGEATMALRSKAKCAGHGEAVKQPADMKVTWQVASGLSAIAHPGPPKAQVEHASALGQPAMKASLPSMPDPAADPTRHRVKVTHTLDAQAAATKCPAGEAKADPAYAMTRSRIAGAKQDGWELRATVNGAELPKQSSENSARAHVDAGKISFRDPLWVSVTNLDTNIMTTEELFSLSLTGESQQAAISFEYDLESGLTLNIGRNAAGLLDGVFSIAGKADSSWLVSAYGSFGATLSNGVFSATGAWAAAPWLLTYQGTDVVAAHLDAAFLPTVFDYQVPGSVITSDNSEYQQDFEVECELTASAMEIPEPASLLLLALGGLGVTRRARVRA